MRDNDLYSKRSLRLTSGFLLTATLLSAHGHAASFDDAVNHYLKGFEACQDANKLLQGKQWDKAKSKMAEYQRYFKEAQAIDKSIAFSKERNMEGNVQICKRIDQDISNGIGEPVMDKALAQCKAAEKALEGEDPEAARAMLEEFRKLRDEALGISPGLKEIFAIKNQLSKCDRFENKIGRVAAKQEAEDDVVSSAKSASESYLSTCSAASETLRKDAVDDNTLRNANGKINTAAGFKKSATNNAEAKKVFSKRPDHPDKAVIDGNIKKGDACIADLQKQIATKTSEIANIRKSIGQYEAQASSLANTCDDAKTLAAAEPTEANYNTAKKKLQEAATQEKQLQQKLANDANYKKAISQGLGGATQQKLDAAGKCIDNAGTQLAQLQKAMNAKKAELAKAEADAKKLAELKTKQEAEEKKKAEAEAKAKAEALAKAEAEAKKAEADAKKAEEKAKADALAQAEAAKKLEKAAKEQAEANAKAAKAAAATAAAAASAASAASDTKNDEENNATDSSTTSGDSAASGVEGQITLNVTAPDFAIFYLQDGSKAPTSIEAEINTNGFKQGIYVVNPGARVDIKNNDNSLHRFTIEDAYSNYKGPMTMVQSRQKKSFTADWPVNRAVQIRSEKATQTPAYVVTLGGANYEVMNLKSGRAAFNLSGSGADKGYLVMPGFDPVELNFNGGTTATGNITQNGEKVGEIKVVGH